MNINTTILLFFSSFFRVDTALQFTGYIQDKLYKTFQTKFPLDTCTCFYVIYL